MSWRFIAAASSQAMFASSISFCIFVSFLARPLSCCSSGSLRCLSKSSFDIRAFSSSRSFAKASAHFFSCVVYSTLETFEARWSPRCVYDASTIRYVHRCNRNVVGSILVNCRKFSCYRQNREHWATTPGQLSFLELFGETANEYKLQLGFNTIYWMPFKVQPQLSVVGLAQFARQRERQHCLFASRMVAYNRSAAELHYLELNPPPDGLSGVTTRWTARGQ